MTLTALCAALVLAAPPANPDPLKVPLPKITDAMPFTRLLAQDLAQLPDPELSRVVDQLYSKLFLDEATTMIEVASDLELALRYATAVQLLEGRPAVVQANGPALRRHARAAAFLLYTTGYAYETREDVRASVEAILPPPNTPNVGNRPALESLIAAIRTMRFYGNHWFVQVITQAKAETPDDLGVVVQEAWWLEHEGKLLEAAERFTRALALRVTDTVAIAAYDAFLEAGSPETDVAATSLRDTMVKAYPILAKRFDNSKGYADAVSATALYEHNIGQATVDEAIAQLPRYLRLDRPGAADLLAREVLGRWPKEQKAWHAAAETWFQLGRFESLRTLLIDAEAAGRFDARLREVRIAARAKLLLNEALGAAHHPLADGDFQADLDAFVKAGGGAGSHADLAMRATKVYIALARYIALSQQAGLPKTAVNDAIGATEKEVDALLAARPKDPQALALAVTAYAGLDAPLRAVARIGPMADRLGDAGLETAFLIARVEAGIALRTRDAALMKSALARFAKIEKRLAKGKLDRASFTLAVTVARLGSQVLGGEALSADAIAKAQAALAPLDLVFDESEIDGRTSAQALELTRASLLLLSAKPATPDGAATLSRALDGFRAARQARRDGELGLLAGGFVQWMIGDARGAYELFERALAQTARPALVQWLAFVQAQAAGQVGEMAAARAAAVKAVAQWQDAHLPETLAQGTARPIFVGDFDLGLRIVAGEPLTMQLRANPTLALLPEVASSRAETQAFIDQIDKAGATPVSPRP